MSPEEDVCGSEYRSAEGSRLTDETALLFSDKEKSWSGLNRPLQ